MTILDYYRPTFATATESLNKELLQDYENYVGDAIDCYYNICLDISAKRDMCAMPNTFTDPDPLVLFVNKMRRELGEEYIKGRRDERLAGYLVDLLEQDLGL